MIVYKIDVMESLKEAGYNPKRIKDEKIMSEVSLQTLREKRMVGIKTLNALCRVLDMQPGNIIKFVEDPPEANNR